jgi:hypothetical protein
MLDMTLQIEFPEEVAALLGPDPTAAVREAVLLQLVHEGKITVARAGQLLGLDREDSIRWYTGHGYPFPLLTPAELQQDLDHLKALGG